VGRHAFLFVIGGRFIQVMFSLGGDCLAFSENVTDSATRYD